MLSKVTNAQKLIFTLSLDLGAKIELPVLLGKVFQMSPHHYPPYLRSGLWNLAKPSVWGTAIFLSVVGFSSGEYLMHPESFTRQESQPVIYTQPSEASLSKEDRAIAADIDNTPDLMGSFEQATPNPPEVINQPPQQQSSPQPTPTFQTSPNPSLETVQNPPPPDTPNTFVVQGENLLTSGTGGQSSTQTDRNLGTGATTNPESPLQLAINQSTTHTTQVPSSNSLPSTPVETGQSVPVSSYTQPQIPQPTDLSVPAPSYTQPQIPITSYTQPQTPQQSVPVLTTPYGYANYGNLQQPAPVPSVQPTPQSQPTYSYPRGIPGHYLGR